jgi:hypothetical protein
LTEPGVAVDDVQPTKVAAVPKQMVTDALLVPALIDPLRVAEFVVTEVAATADALGGVGAVEVTVTLS